MKHFIPVDNIVQFVSDCIVSGMYNPETDTSAVFYDVDHLSKQIELLKKAFPSNTFHTAAIKANPLIKILQKVKDLHLGAEAASEGELHIALNAGFANEQIVFDSPVKTYEELAFALKNNIHINADSLMELDRIARLKESIKSDSKIGLRINPQVGYGKILSTSLAGDYSKFGVPLKSNKNEILKYFEKYDWLSGIHMHIGSQGCDMDMLLDGIELGLKLILDIKETVIYQGRNVEFMDIGGGLPISYHHNVNPPDIMKYGKLVQNLLSFYELDNLKLITEFGRFLHANSGFIVSKIEYTKHYKESNTLMIHSGADIMLRECLNPQNWYHEISLLDKNGQPKHSDKKLKYNIGGPLCFANDIVARNIELPKAEEGDIIVIHDTGGYTFGMWSKYVSRAFPKIIGIEKLSYEILRKKDRIKNIVNFWQE